MTHNSSRFLSVNSINYDYIPGQLESPKILWVALTRPPPKDFKVNSLVRLHLKPGRGIRTFRAPPTLFYVNDIIGLRVSLIPSSKTWALQGGCKNFGWGYNTRRVDVRPSRHNWSYGYGVHSSFLEY